MHARDSESGVVSSLHALQRSSLMFWFGCKGRHVVLAYEYELVARLMCTFIQNPPKVNESDESDELDSVSMT